MGYATAPLLWLHVVTWIYANYLAKGSSTDQKLTTGLKKLRKKEAFHRLFISISEPMTRLGEEKLMMKMFKDLQTETDVFIFPNVRCICLNHYIQYVGFWGLC